MSLPHVFEVIIIGGSYAGLSAAMTLGRSLRQTLVIDAGKPCNRFTPTSHNFLTQDGKKPEEIAAIALQQVQQYESVRFTNDWVDSIQQHGIGFEIHTRTDQTFACKKLILATGILDQLPEIPGFQECWGKTIIHCPYCHGYEFRGKRTGILADQKTIQHLAPLLLNLSPRLVAFTQGDFPLALEDFNLSGGSEIQIVTEKISQINHNEGKLSHLLLANGAAVELDALYAPRPFSLSGELHKMLACDLAESGHISVDDFQQTSTAGVFACGDNASPMRSIANAVASGNKAGAMVNWMLSSAN